MLLIPAICFFLNINILNALNDDGEQERNVTVSLHYHKDNCFDDYDITTIYRFNKDIHSSTVCQTKQIGDVMFSLNIVNKRYSIEIHSRTNAIGIPLSIENTISDHFPSDNNLRINIAEFRQYGFIQNDSHMNIEINSNVWNQKTIGLTGEQCEFESNNPTSKYTEYKFDKCFDTLEYRYDYEYLSYGHKLLTVIWEPAKNQTCLSITYFHSLNSEMEIIMSISDENDTLITSPTLEKHDSITTLKVTNMELIKDKEYKISLQIRTGVNNGYYGYWFGILRITQCSDYDEEEVRVVSMNNTAHNQCEPPKPFNILGNDIDGTRVCKRFPILSRWTSIMDILEEGKMKSKNISTNSCLNGGFMIISKCVCPPGFKGQFCEIGCGSNFYGADCKGVCSMYDNKMCRGLMMCTKYYGCTCPPGLTGQFCDEDCEPGKYGADCKQTCSSNCHNNKCDQFTGICYQGCSEGYFSPYCLKKYPYLINPPTLLLNDYESIEIELNFKSKNVKGGDPNMKLKYYQIFYKSLIEDEFSKSEFKLINEHNDENKDIIYDLDPDTTYKIGVLVITEDGNFNHEDIVYGLYTTSCIQPEIYDYNIQLISGIKSVNITWDKIYHRRLECNIIEYVLTLTFNQTQNQINGVEEIKSSTNSGHLIENLYPGYNYSVFLTPKTSKGPLVSSRTYSFSPLMTRNDVSIKDLVATVDADQIKISWKFENAYHPDTIVKEPFMCVVRYKLQRILSCSLEKLEHNWTTVTIFNRTSYRIFDTIPNSQYVIQVKVNVDNINRTQQETQIYALTLASNPKTEPVLELANPIHVTNDSVSVKWKVDPVNCSKLNGFFSMFRIELKDKADDIVQVIETNKDNFYVNDLKSNNYYELKVFIKTHFGFNPEHFLFTSFTTKSRNLAQVDDLTIYKKSLKYRLVGIRWYYSENANLIGFIVSFNKENSDNTNNSIVIPANKCSAWPEYYCHTFHNLNHTNNMTFNIKPRSIDYPEGGKVSSISFNINDELPDPPSNFKIVDIGNTFMTLQWDIPWIFNSVLKMYYINVEEISYVDMNLNSSIQTIEFPVYEELPSYNYTLAQLNPGSTYSIRILSVSKSLWYSLPVKIQATTLLNT